MTTLALIAAITLVHATTQQECTFDSLDQAETFLRGVEDPDSWSLKQPEPEVDQVTNVQTAQAADDGANVLIKANTLADATAALDDLVKPVANIEPSAGL